MARFVDTGTVAIAYDTAGTGDPAVVFVPGWSCDRTYFAPQFEHFAARHAVVTVDLRGHGESSRIEPGAGIYAISAFADDVLAVAETLGFIRPVVVGHSLGALVALECAARAGAVRAAIMVDPPPITDEERKAFFRDSFEAVADDDDGSWRRQFVEGMFLPTDTARREDIVDGMTQLPRQIAAAALRSIADFDGVAALQAVDVPLLSIGSAEPSDTAADLRRACPSITIGQTVGSGHFIQLEVPDQVNLMVERFLAINRM
jgi:pimeloyl-ACP methyl ester carboxylesterase